MFELLKFLKKRNKNNEILQRLILTQWTKTLALAIELPFNADENQIWEKLVNRHPKYTEFFITATTTIDINKIPYIGYSMLRWFDNQENIEKKLRQNFETVHIEFIHEFRRRMIAEISSFNPEALSNFTEKYEKYKNKLHSMNDPHDVFKKFIDFFNDVDIELEEINKDEKDENSF